LALILGALPLAWAFMQVPGCSDDDNTGGTGGTSGAVCSPAGATCTSNTECCNRDCEGNGRCDNDQSVNPDTGCLGSGAVCSTDTECCNNDCDDNGTCDDDQGPEGPGGGGNCSPENAACTVNADCCSNDCESDGCD
jgi:hypothetical protein